MKLPFTPYALHHAYAVRTAVLGVEEKFAAMNQGGYGPCFTGAIARAVARNLLEDPEPEAEVDKMWSFGPSKDQQRWLWWALDHATGQVLAYVLATYEDEAFVQLKTLLEAFSMMQF